MIKIRGFREFFSNCDMQELKNSWGPFLNGEKIYLHSNEIYVRTDTRVVPDRKAAEKLARILIAEGNDFFCLSRKMDFVLDVDCTIDETSARVTYLRIGKGDELVRKVLVKISFGFHVVLSKPIEAVPESFFQCPRRISVTDNFYAVAKTFLNNLDKYVYVSAHDYISPVNPSREAMGRNYAYETSSSRGENFGFPNDEFWNFASKYFLVQGEKLMDYVLDNVILPNGCMAVKIGVAPSDKRRRKGFSSSDVQQVIDSLRVMPSKMVNLFEGMSVNEVVGDFILCVKKNGKNGSAEMDTALALAEKKLNRLLELTKAVEAFGSGTKEWRSLIGDFDQREEFEGQFSRYDRFFACTYFKRIEADPLLYVDSPHKVSASLAKALIAV